MGMDFPFFAVVVEMDFAFFALLLEKDFSFSVALVLGLSSS
jgi:hypothetical protein